MINNIVDVRVVARYIARYGLSMNEDGYFGTREHLLVLGCVYLTSIFLVFAPHAVLDLHYRCILSMVTGIRCPFCGMTRDFILMFQGLPPRNNPGSLMAAVAIYVAYPVWLALAALWRPNWLQVSRRRLRNVLVGIMLVLFVSNNFGR